VRPADERRERFFHLHRHSQGESGSAGFSGAKPLIAEDFVPPCGNDWTMTEKPNRMQGRLIGKQMGSIPPSSP